MGHPQFTREFVFSLTARNAAQTADDAAGQLAAARQELRQQAEAEDALCSELRAAVKKGKGLFDQLTQLQWDVRRHEAAVATAEGAAAAAAADSAGLMLQLEALQHSRGVADEGLGELRATLAATLAAEAAAAAAWGTERVLRTGMRLGEEHHMWGDSRRV